MACGRSCYERGRLVCKRLRGECWSLQILRKTTEGMGISDLQPFRKVPKEKPPRALRFRRPPASARAYFDLFT
jgi:hypothetical protein